MIFSGYFLAIASISAQAKQTVCRLLHWTPIYLVFITYLSLLLFDGERKKWLIALHFYYQLGTHEVWGNGQHSQNQKIDMV